jgi:hypothetical protein
MNAALPCLALMAALAGSLFNYAPELLPSAFPIAFWRTPFDHDLLSLAR